MFFSLSSLELGLILFGIVLGSTLVGWSPGEFSAQGDALREPFGVIQAALLGLVAVVLAPGLTMAVGRYDARRPAVVAFGLLALYLAIPSRGAITVLLAARSWP